MNSSFLLSELQSCPLENVSEERLRAYIRIGVVLYDWYFVLGPDEEMSVSWPDCRKSLVLLFEECRHRLGRSDCFAVQARLLCAMGQCSRMLRMGEDDRRHRIYEQSVDRFFRAWEESGTSCMTDFSEEIDFLALIYEDRRDCPDNHSADTVCGYYFRRMQEILTVLLQHTSQTHRYDETSLLQCLCLLAKSQGSFLDLHRDAEIRRLCNLYMSDMAWILERHESFVKSINCMSEETRRNLLLLMTWQETLEACGGWCPGSLEDQLSSLISRTEGIYPPASDEWWLQQSLVLRQRFAACVI